VHSETAAAHAFNQSSHAVDPLVKSSGNDGKEAGWNWKIAEWKNMYTPMKK